MEAKGKDGKSWEERIAEENAQEKQKNRILKNAELTSDPEFHCTLVLLASLASNSHPSYISKTEKNLVEEARSLAAALLKSFKEE